jgi:hypothetical protein
MLSREGTVLILDRRLEAAQAAYEHALSVFNEVPSSDPAWFVALHHLNEAQARYELLLSEAIERVRRERGLVQ